MKSSQFSSPHSHPASLDSASTPEAFAKRAKELGAISLCCTDHGTLQACYKIYELGKKNGLIPVLGLEAYFRDDNCPILTKLGIQKTPSVPKGQDKEVWKQNHPDGSFFDYLKYQHMTLHFMDYPAYLKAVKLLSDADERAEQHGSERKPLFGWNQIEELASMNVIAGSSCLVGMTERHLVHQNNPEAAILYFKRLKHLFKDRFYAEMFPHVCTHDWVNGVFLDVVSESGEKKELQYYEGKKFRTNKNEEDGITAAQLAQKFDPKVYTDLVEVKHYRVWTPFEEKWKLLGVRKVEDFVKNECSVFAPDSDVQLSCNKFVRELAQSENVPMFISDDSHFATTEEKIVQDVRLAQQGSWRFHGSYHMQSSNEAWEYFHNKMGTEEKEFQGWIQNSLDWASRFKNFKFDVKSTLPTKFFPTDSLGHTKTMIQNYGRMVKTPDYMNRLKAEIELFYRNGTMDLLPYFHEAEEVCRIYRNQGILTGPGRGSAGGVLLSYLLGVTHIDPLKYDLSLDRFMTPDRIASGKWPDIDQDLPSRDLLTGMETDVVEFQAEDGTLHIMPETFKVETDKGLMTIHEAFAAGADIKPWWLEKNIAN